MGNICSGRINTESAFVPHRSSIFSTNRDIQFNAGQFVQENLLPFHLVYALFDSPIGSGSYAEVWLCTHKRTSEVRAVKILHKSGISPEDIRQRSVFIEVEILKTLDHPNVLKVYEYFEDIDHYYIVMEYCEGGDLFDKLESEGPLTERYAAKVMKYVLSGLAYLHSRCVVHRDIKPENLLITNSKSFEDFNIKIIDFNVATKKESRTLNCVIGTTDYMAPEVFRGIYDEKCDIWSAGVVLYIMLTCILPFIAPTEEELEKAISSGKFIFPSAYFGKISKDCKDLISKLLVKNPASRPSALQALNHPWFKIAGQNCDRASVRGSLLKMRSIKPSGQLKDLITTFMISQLSHQNSTTKLEKVFYEIDKNRDGVIELSELVEQLSKEMPTSLAEAEAEKIMQMVDFNGSGKIDYTEYLRATVDEQSLLTPENLKKAFYYFDKDNSGTIDREELIKWLSADDLIPEEVIAELMGEADTNGDGTIDINEFQDLLISKLELTVA